MTNEDKKPNENKSGKKSYEPFLNCLKQLKEDEKTVVAELHVGADADAIGLGAAVQYVGEKLELPIDITYGGRLGYENRRLAKLLDVKLKQYTLDDNCLIKPDNYDAIILLDNYGATSLWGKTGRLPKEKVVGLLDHHGLDQILDFPNLMFEDRRSVGSACTIFTEYMMQGLLQTIGITKEQMTGDPEIERLATLLMAGIRQDTGGLLERVKPLDDDANTYLRKYANKKQIINIEKPKLPFDGLDFLGNAIASKQMKEGTVIAKVGRITEDEHDEIAKVSDEFIGRRGVEFAYILGRQPSFFDICFRYNDETLDMDEEIEKLLSNLPQGSGGGKEGAGGIQIQNPLHGSYIWGLVRDDAKEQIEEILSDEILNRLLKPKGNNNRGTTK